MPTAALWRYCDEYRCRLRKSIPIAEDKGVDQRVDLHTRKSLDRRAHSVRRYRSAGQRQR
jgi:hypothetical protein